MTDLNELSREDIVRAVALAARLQQADAAGVSGGDSRRTLAHMAKAVRTVYDEHARAAARRTALVAVVAVGAIAAAVSVAVSTLRQDQAKPPPATEPTQAGIDIHLPPPGDGLLSPIPPGLAPAGQPPVAASGPWSAIRFVNRLSTPIALEWRDFHAWQQPVVHVAPGQTEQLILQCGLPVTVSDSDGHRLGVYYPAGVPATAIVTKETATKGDRPLHGFLESESTAAFPSQVAVAGPARAPRVLGASAHFQTFYNLRKDTVSIYQLYDNGSASYLASLAPGRIASDAASQTWRWLVTDAKRHVIGLYESGPVDRMALLVPDNWK